MISKITQNLAQALDITMFFAIKGTALAGSIACIHTLGLCTINTVAERFFNRGQTLKAITQETTANSLKMTLHISKQKKSNSVKKFEKSISTEKAIFSSALALTSIALGRFALFSKIRF